MKGIEPIKNMGRIHNPSRAMNSPGSTRHHRHLQRANGMSQVLGNAISQLSITAVIPTKVAQTIFSTHAFFEPKLKRNEHAIHGIQAGLAFAQLILVIVLYFKDNSCKEQQLSLCKLLVLFDLLYQGTLLVSWVPAEVNRNIDHDVTTLALNSSRTPSISSNSFYTMDDIECTSTSTRSSVVEEEKNNAFGNI